MTTSREHSSAPPTGRADWGWAPDGAVEIPADAPLYALLGLAGRSLGMLWWQAVQGTGLTPAGLGLLRVLSEQDGLKSSEVASRGWITPATVTSVVDTLVRDGYVERRRDEYDRRVVRLFVTGAGRQVCADAHTAVAPRLAEILSFVDPADEPVIRAFLAEAIERLVGERLREERT